MFRLMIRDEIPFPLWVYATFVVHMIILAGYCILGILLLLIDGEAEPLEKASIYFAIIETLCFLVCIYMIDFSVNEDPERLKYRKALKKTIQSL